MVKLLNAKLTQKIALVIFLTLCSLSYKSLNAQNITFNTVPPLVGGTTTAGGNIFNITTNKRIIIDSIRGSFSTVSGTVNVWWNPIRVNGTPSAISSLTGWTSLGSASMTGLSSATTTAATLQTVPVRLGLTLNPGDTIAIAIQWSGSVYTTNSTTIPVFTDGTISFILDGASAFTMNAGMTTFFNPRQFNGGVVYRNLRGGVNDAAVTELVSPLNFPPGLNDVRVRIANRGSNAITSASVMWSIDDTLKTTFNFVGLLDTIQGTSGPNDTLITLGGIHFPQGVRRKIKVWTSMPNGVADTSNANDTITRFVRPSLAGTFTVGSSTSNFQTLQQAFDTLSAFGIVGPVILEVDSALTGNTTIASIPGTSAANTILVKGFGNTITSNIQPVIGLSGARNIVFDSLNVLLNATTGFGYHLGLGSQFITIRNSTINVGTTSTATSNGGIVASGSQTVITTTGNNAQNITVENNTLIGGYYGLSLVGSGTYLGSTGHVVRNNTFLDNYFGGIYLNSTDTVLVERNTISRATRSTISTYYGIYGTTTRNTKVRRNRIHSTGSGSYICYPIWFGTSINSVGFETEIVNNSIWNIPTTGTLHGINLTISTTGFRIYHNSVYLNLAASSTGVIRGINFGVAPNAVDFRNNIISIAGNGTGVKSVVHVLTTSTTFAANRNVYHMAATGGTNLIGFWTANRTSLSDWQTASLQDTASLSSDPVFFDINSGSLEPASANIDNLGLPIAGIPTDILGNTRSLTTPDAGAYEFIGVNADLQLSAANLILASCNSTNDTLKVKLKNRIGSSLNFATQPLNIRYTITGPINRIDSLVLNSGSLLPGQELEYTVATNINRSIFGTYQVLVFIPIIPGNDNATNDTLRFSIQPPLNGNYNIAIGSINFPTVQSVFDTLSLRGVCGAVNITLNNNNAIFNESVQIRAIPGSSEIRTITIKGRNNTLQSPSSPILRFNGAANMIIDSLNIIAPANYAGFGIHFGNASKQIVYQNSIVNVGTTSTTTTNAAIVASGSTATATTAGNNAQQISILNNVIIGGYYGIILTGEASYLNNTGHIIRNNIVRDFHLYGIYTANANNVTIDSNDLHRMGKTTLTTFYGYYGTTSRNIKLTKNRIHDAGTGSYTAYPIWFSTSVNLLGQESEIINNAVYNINTTGTLYGMYFSGTTDRFKIYHNTIDANGGGTGTKRAAFFSVAPNNTDFKNNILSVSGTGTGAKHCIYVSTISTSFGSNHNVFYMGAIGGTNNLGYWTNDQSTLGNWQLASGKDSLSSSSNPVYSNLSLGNVSPLSINIDNMGTYVGVDVDFYGNTRPLGTPDVGCAEFTGVNGDIGLTSASLKRSSVCYSTNDSLSFTISNIIGGTIDFSLDPTTIVYQISGPVPAIDSIVLNTGTLVANSSLKISNANANLSLPGNYALTAYVRPNAINFSKNNDTLGTPFNLEVKPIISVSPKTGIANSPTDTFRLTASSPLFPGGGAKFTEVCHWRLAAGAAPTGGWPAYLLADDYVELIGVPNSDLAGFTMEEWTGTTLQHTVTFPTGTIFSPNGTMIIATGQLGASVPSPANFYYHSGNSITHGSTGIVGYVLKNSSGTVVDATVYGAYTFPAASGVTAADWTGSTPNVSSAGNKLTGPDNNTSSNWVTAASPFLQDPNILNPSVPLPSPGNMSGFNWYYLGNPIDTNARIKVGPYTTPGVYQYVAVYSTICGIYTDTVTITATTNVPVLLSKFDVKKNQSDVNLTWETALEINNDYFEVERSTDNLNFETIAKIKGNGNSSKTQRYSHIDLKAVNVFENYGQLYYRLNQVDFDGSNTLSETKVVTLNKLSTLQLLVQPNPNNGNFTVNVGELNLDELVMINIIDMFGNTVYVKETKLEEGQIRVNANLASGVYTVLLNCGEFTKTARILIK